MMLRDNFAIFILSHGRPDKVATLTTLDKCGYTGKVYIIVDNLDSTVDAYIEKFGTDRVIVFDKAEAALTTDTYESRTNLNGVVFARNECFNIARKLGLKYFLELDDDYVRFEYRYADSGKLMTILLDNMDEVCEHMLQFLDDTGATCVAFSQGGDFIGGVESRNFKLKVVRKVMNSFFCSVDKEFSFAGIMNDDVNTYTTLGMRGELFLTYTPLSLVQLPTQSHAGGLSDMYSSLGTYRKSFYSIVSAPSCVRINMMGDKHQRIHHVIDWEHCYPKIVPGCFRRNS